jgi:hypothetical protein
LISDRQRNSASDRGDRRWNTNPDGGHGGGDYYLMDRFIHAVMANDQNMILSGPDESLESHLMVFAAERARKENSLVTL